MPLLWRKPINYQEINDIPRTLSPKRIYFVFSNSFYVALFGKRVGQMDELWQLDRQVILDGLTATECNEVL